MSQLRPGDVVKGCFEDDQWYLAEVEKDNGDGTYTISWFDGDPSNRVRGLDCLIRMKFNAEFHEYREDAQHEHQSDPQPSDAGAGRGRSGEAQRCDGERGRRRQGTGECALRHPTDRDAESDAPWGAERRYEHGAPGAGKPLGAEDRQHPEAEAAHRSGSEGTLEAVRRAGGGAEQAAEEMAAGRQVVQASALRAPMRRGEPKTARKCAEEEAEARHGMFDFDALPERAALEADSELLLYNPVAPSRRSSEPSPYTDFYTDS